MGILAVTVAIFAVMLLLAAVTLLRRVRLSKERVCEALKSIYARISRYAAIIFILFLLLALSYEQTKELVNTLLPSQNIEQIKHYIKFIFRSESVFSAVEAVAIYSLLVSCCTGLGAIFVKGVQAFICHRAVSYSDKREVRVAAVRFEERVALKSFLVYSRYNS